MPVSGDPPLTLFPAGPDPVRTGRDARSGPAEPASRSRRRPPAPATAPDPQARVVSVLPAVASIDRSFDYVVPSHLDAHVRLGSVVRVDLGERRVAGWIVGDAVEPPAGLALRPLSLVTGWGPEPEIVELSTWAAWRWAGRRAALLASASPDGAVAALPGPDRRRPRAPDRPGDLAALVGRAGSAPIGLLRLPPGADTTAVVALLAQRGPTLVVVPSMQRAAVLADRLRRAGAGVAELPHQWAQARAGAGIVIGPRTAAWGPCPGLAAVVVLDAHDEGLVQEQAPTWWATAVVAERARRAGVPCVWVTPCPTLDLLAAGTLVTPDVTAERSGWAHLEVVDRRADDPRLGLYSERLVEVLRSAERFVCVLNRTGRARLLACGSCGELTRCERCGAAVAQSSFSAPSTTADLSSRPASPPSIPAAPSSISTPSVSISTPSVSTIAGAAPFPLVCARCGTIRPPVCAVCDSARLRHLRVGVTRVRDELEALVGRPVGEVTAVSGTPADQALLVGTEAVLHRVTGTDVVAFLEFDQELGAPRFRAGEEAMTLLARASRLVGGRRRGGWVLVQTRSPHHDVLDAAGHGDPGLLDETEIRTALGLPPIRALAAISGPGAEALIGALPPGRGVETGGDEAKVGDVKVGDVKVGDVEVGDVEVGEVEVLGPTDGRWLLRAAAVGTLCDVLAAAPRPAARVRIQVDPLRV
jgi:primosomal protein N' (replication factor Y)